jgi:DNA polymerase-3 subunit epsilon
MFATPRISAIQAARRHCEARPVYLDTETTGMDNGSEIVEICILDDDGSPLLDSLVRPLRPIPWDVCQIHHITDDMVCEAPTWLELWPKVAGILAGRVVGIYNAEFDLRLMRQSHRAHRLPWQPPVFSSFCIMKLYAQYYGAYRWLSLERAGRECRISLPNAHRARADTLLARAVLHYIAGSET